MTYLELVNAVLTRMREDPVNTLSGQSDVVVNLAKDFVNDAKKIVEDAHTWTAHTAEWDITTVAGTSEYTLTDSPNAPVIHAVFGTAGRRLRNTTTADMKKRQLAQPADGTPYYWTVSGAAANRDVKVKLHPTPSAAETVSFTGFHKQDVLSADTDVLLVPHQPVLYMAYALAARERGEVGGQTAAELFTMAGQYLKDAIALDAELNPSANIWYDV